MATKYAGKDLNLYKNNGTEESPDWELIVCLTDTGLSGDKEVLEANSKCGVDATQGNITWTSDFSGFMAIDPAAGQISHSTLIDDFQGDEEAEFLITDSVDNPTVWRRFTAFMSAYEETYNNGDTAGFSGTLRIKGSIDTDIPNTSTLSAPGSFTATADGISKIDLTWSSVTNATNYVIERATSADFKHNYQVVHDSATGTSFEDNGLSPNTQYYYRIKAIAAGYNSSPYATDDATTADIV